RGARRRTERARRVPAAARLGRLLRARAARTLLRTRRLGRGAPAGARRTDVRARAPVSPAAALRARARRAAADRIGRLLRAVRAAARGAGRGPDRAARRRREPDPRRPRGGPRADRDRRRRAVRLVPRPPGDALARRRVAADPRDTVRRRTRHALPAGVVLGAPARSAAPDELRPRDR